MKKFSDLCKKGFDYGYRHASEIENWCLESFLKNNNIQTPTDEQLEWYARNHWDNSNSNYGYMTDTIFHPSQWVNEMLSSVKFDMLYKQLNQEIGVGFRKGEVVNQKGMSFLLIPKKYWENNYNDIVLLVDKFFWTITSFLTTNNKYEPTGTPLDVEVGKHVYVEIVLEPVMSENMTKWVMDDCDGKIYHITNKKNLKKILKSGLRMRGEGNDYRFIKNKIYFTTGDTFHRLLSNIINICQSKGLKIHSDNNKLCTSIVMVDLKKHKYDVSFYKDTFYDNNDGMVYTYAYFPPSMLEDVTEKYL